MNLTSTFGRVTTPEWSGDRARRASYTRAMALFTRLVASISPTSAIRLPRPRRIDWAIGASLLVLLVVEAIFDDLPGVGFGVVAGLVAIAAFVWRRVQPLLALLTVAATSIVVDLTSGLVDHPVEGTLAEGLAALTVIYCAARWGSARAVTASLLLAALAVPLASMANPHTEPGLLLLGFDILATVVLIAIGLLIRSNAEAKEQRELTEALEERNRLANDIHDSFAHHMSAIAVRAEAARQLDDPAALDEALTAIKRSASIGLTDMRHLVAGLRAPDDDARPLPGFGDMQQLANELTTDSLRIELIIDADPELIPVSTSAVAYWIAREALTNVSRHATGATMATVRVRGTDNHLDLTVTDDGSTPIAPESASGHGLRSMTERARSLGGELSAGPNPKGGWLVSARLPLHRGES